MDTKINSSMTLEIAKAIVVNSMMNSYAVERVAFGLEKAGDKVPVELYTAQLGLPVVEDLSCIHGAYIDENYCIRNDISREDCVRELFVTKMENIFEHAPKDRAAERAEEEVPILPRFREYVLGLLPLFTEIMKTETDYDVFDIKPRERMPRSSEYVAYQKFVSAILLKPLRTGSRIDRYVKDFTLAPYYIRRLIEKKGKSFYLKTADIERTEYKFALFSSMLFLNVEHNCLLETKIKQSKISV